MLKYKGNKYLLGVPARDLTDDEVEKFGGEEALLATGVYIRVETKMAKPPTENKSIKDKEK